MKQLTKSKFNQSPLYKITKKHMKEVIFQLCLYILVTGDDFTTFREQMERKVEDLASEMQTAFGRRCDYEVATCQTLSYDDCQGTSTKVCHEQFPTAGGCLGGGAFMSETSTVRFPNSVDTNSLSEEQKQFVCTSALLEDSFLGLDDGRESRYGKAYIGTNLGSFRSYPSTRQIDPDTGLCPEYDPRFRPWYVAATSGAKNVILLVDVSGSMEGDRLDIAKDAAISVVNTLSNSDFVGVLSFANDAKTVYTEKITRATTEVKEKIIEKINSLQAQGQTNYQAAFSKGFSLLNAATTDQYGAPCADGENVFLFLTDGEPTTGYTTSSDLINHIDAARGSKDITLFTYALGAGTDPDILQDLSCEYSGIMFKIEDSSSTSELATVMKNYHTYISEGVTISAPVWTEPYEDAFGFGRMVTVSMPIYYTENDIRSVLGVAGIDILWDQISFGMDEEEVIDQLIRNAPCHASSLSECEIENLRQKSCDNEVCNISSHSFSQCNESASIVLKTGEDVDENLCCSLSIGALVGIIVALVVVLGVIIGICVWKIRKGRDYSDPNENNQGSMHANNNPNPYFNQYVRQ